MFGRGIKTRLYLLYPNKLEKNKLQKTAKMHTEEFKLDDTVWIRNYSGQPKWIAGEVFVKVGCVATRQWYMNKYKDDTLIS